MDRPQSRGDMLSPGNVLFLSGREVFMKQAQLVTGLFAALLVLALSVPASAAFTLYDKEGATFSADGFFNTFYVQSSSDKNAAMEALIGPDRDQSRVKMGFLPNYIGFNFSKQVDNLKLGGRSSFWVSINDSDDSGAKVTDTGIDVRQFYGTVEGDWGQILIGKDFTLFSRSNIFLDEILMGYGNVSDFLGLVDGGGVSFGNIGSGYIYPGPSAQITYRTPNMGGFKLAVGIIDPSRMSDAADAEENTPRLEAELTFNHSFDQGSVTAWVGGVTQKSESAAGPSTADVDTQGFSYGVNAKFAGLSLTGSGFTAEGMGLLTTTQDRILGLGPLVSAAGEELESEGYLAQGSYTFDKVRLVGSYGKNEYNIAGNSAPALEDETITGAVFYSINDYLKVVAEYNINTITLGSAEEETKTIALGGIINF